MQRKSILITGAAAGIGRAMAEEFAGHGWFVGAYDVDVEGVSALRDELGDDRCHAGELDVTDRAAWDRALQDFLGANRSGRLNALVNNAGVLDSGEFQQIPMDSHARIVNINVIGVMNGCHAAFSALKGVEDACIINLASASAIYGQPALASYSASKFAVRGLTEGLNLEWEKYGIRVVDLWPIFVKTAMVEGMRADSIEKMGVKLTPRDVALTARRAAEAGPDSRRVHWMVGWETVAFSRLVRLLPSRVSRFVAKQLAT